MANKSFDYGLENLPLKDASPFKLVAEWAETRIHLALYHVPDARLVAAESFDGSIEGNYGWSELARNSSLLQLRDVPLHFLSAGKQAMAIPQDLFNSPDANSQLDILYPSGGPWRPYATNITEHHLVWFYRLPLAAAQFAEENFRQVSYGHTMARLLQQPGTTEGATGFLIVYPNFVWLRLMEDNKLVYAWYLPVLSPDDLVYRLLYVCQRFKIDHTQAAWIATGLFEENGALYQALYKFLPHLNILEADALNGNNEMELPAHYLGYLKQIAL